MVNDLTSLFLLLFGNQTVNEDGDSWVFMFSQRHSRNLAFGEGRGEKVVHVLVGARLGRFSRPVVVTLVSISLKS